MRVMVVACYKPKPDQAPALLDLMKTHLPVLRAEGLVDDGPSMCGRANDGTVVEIFCWKSQEAIDKAHENPKVQAMWNDYAKVCDYVAIADVEGAKGLFTALTPVELG